MAMVGGNGGVNVFVVETGLSVIVLDLSPFGDDNDEVCFGILGGKSEEYQDEKGIDDGGDKFKNCLYRPIQYSSLVL